jgi:hypothetical protein
MRQPGAAIRQNMLVARSRIYIIDFKSDLAGNSHMEVPGLWA